MRLDIAELNNICRSIQIEGTRKQQKDKHSDWASLISDALIGNTLYTE